MLGPLETGPLSSSSYIVRPVAHIPVLETRGSCHERTCPVLRYFCALKKKKKKHQYYFHWQADTNIIKRGRVPTLNSTECQSRVATGAPYYGSAAHSCSGPSWLRCIPIGVHALNTRSRIGPCPTAVPVQNRPGTIPELVKSDCRKVEVPKVSSGKQLQKLQLVLSWSLPNGSCHGLVMICARRGPGGSP